MSDVTSSEHAESSVWATISLYSIWIRIFEYDAVAVHAEFHSTPGMG